MRIQTIPILLAVVLIAAGVSLSPVGPGPGILAAHQGQGEDHDRGHGNNAGGRDEDNPGRGNDPGEPPVIAGGGYIVEVDCDFDDDDNITECDISVDDVGDPPDIGRVTVPEESVCADVIDGTFVYLSPDSGTIITGYASEADDDDLELELRGRVTTGGTQTYWISTIDGVFPAEGPALQCDQPDAAALDPTETAIPATTVPTQPASTPVPTTGSLAVVTYICTDMPEDRSGFDWFGRCERGGEAVSFSLTPSGGSEKASLTQEPADGTARFERIEPGAYRLDAVDASWCHATSDNVTAESELVVDAGRTTTVWVFLCDDAPTGV